MGNKTPATIKDPEQYEALREGGASKAKAARISNASAATSRSAVARRGGAATNYEDRTKDDLYRVAQEFGIEGRSRMSKQQLIDALRAR